MIRDAAGAEPEEEAGSLEARLRRLARRSAAGGARAPWELECLKSGAAMFWLREDEGSEDGPRVTCKLNERGAVAKPIPWEEWRSFVELFKRASTARLNPGGPSPGVWVASLEGAGLAADWRLARLSLKEGERLLLSVNAELGAEAFEAWRERAALHGSLPLAQGGGRTGRL